MDDLTYAEVGATREGPLPTPYRQLTYRTLIGAGVMEPASQAVLTWRMHRAAGVLIETSTSSAAPGTIVVSRLGVGPLRLAAPCRVVWAEHTPNHAGFGYGTLPGHPMRGEEAFAVSRTDSDEVWFTITAFSLPVSWYARAGGPVIPLLQKEYARYLGHTLRRLCRT
jgi:uncharacterized protein (UPF0548 family)